MDETEALLVQIQLNLNQKKEKLARQTVKASQDTLAKWSTATNDYCANMDAKWSEIQAKYETPLKAAHQKRLVLLKDIRKTLMELETGVKDLTNTMMQDLDRSFQTEMDDLKEAIQKTSSSALALENSPRR